MAVMPLFPSWALALGASPHNRLLLWQGVALFSLFGVGTTMSATAINALLVDRIPKKDRGSAMTLLWILTLGGFIFGSLLISFLYPEFDPATLTQVFILVTVLALALTIWGAWGVEPRRRVVPTFLARQLDFWLTIRFLGSKATLWLDNQGARLFESKSTGTTYNRTEKPHLTKEIRKPLSDIEHIQNFVDCCQSRKEPNAPVEVGHTAVCGPHLANVAYLNKTRARLNKDATKVYV